MPYVAIITILGALIVYFSLPPMAVRM